MEKAKQDREVPSFPDKALVRMRADPCAVNEKGETPSARAKAEAHSMLPFRLLLVSQG